VADRALRVLLVEDDEEDYVLARHSLVSCAELQFEVSHADRLATALTHIDSREVDAVLLDLTLPDSAGLDTFARIRGHAPHIPVIILTGLDDDELGSKAVNAGAQDYIYKGRMDAYSLGRTVRYAVARKKIEEKLGAIARELRERNEQNSAELDMAREVQVSFMPRQYPTFPPSAPPGESRLRFAHHYDPARVLGGDFLSIFSTSETTAGILICDVMGHGVRSALITAVVRGMVEELRPLAVDPGALLTELNQGLTKMLRHPDRLVFVSAACAAIDSGAGTLSCANAGHPRPLHVVAGTSGVVQLGPAPEDTRPALGIDDRCEYDTLSYAMSPADKVLLYTDGLYEARSPQGNEYGRQRLLHAVARYAALPVDGFISSIAESLTEFCGSSDCEDDVCLVAAQLDGGRGEAG